VTRTLILLLSILVAACGRREEQASADTFQPTGTLADLVYNPVRPDGTIDSSFLPILVFDDPVFDFGEANEGDLVEKAFHFTNRGTAPLLIERATSSCGCTVPDWPRAPIPPDSTGVVEVVFNTAGKPGAQTKQVTIFANTFPNEQKLTIRGNVKPAN